jgi:hypothetical protein
LGTSVARTGFANNNSVEAAEHQFARGFIDPVTGQPYPNLVPAGPEPGGRYALEFVNWAQAAPANSGGFNNGNGYADVEIPGVPSGDTAAQNWIVGEALTYLELKAGVHQFIVNCDDGFKLSALPDFRSALSAQLGLRSPGGGGTDVFVNFIVEQDGIYPIRLFWWEGTGGANAEFVVVDQTSGARRLINDRTAYFGIKAYRTGAGPNPPYLAAANPGHNARVVPANTAIEATISNLGTGTVVMSVNGAPVTPVVTPSDANTVVRYQPPTPLAIGSLATVELRYGGVTNTWSFRVQTGPKVLYVLANPAAINASDQAIIDRFTSLGFDLVVVEDLISRAADAEGAALIAISETVGAADVNTKFRDVAVPVITWESALADDFLLTDSVANLGTLAAQTNLIITDATHPLAAGLSAGTRIVATSPATFVWAIPAATAKTIATLADGTGNPAIFGYDKGAMLADGATPAPARRVFVFPLGDAYTVLNDDGKKLMDAAFGWAMNSTFPPSKVSQPKFNQPASSGGNVTLTWAGTGRLQESTDLRTWTNVAGNPASGFQVTAGAGAKFYRLSQ